MQDQSASLSLVTQRACGQMITAGKQAKQQVCERWKLADNRFSGRVKKQRWRKILKQSETETVFRVTFLGVAGAVKEI